MDQVRYNTGAPASNVSFFSSVCYVTDFLNYQNVVEGVRARLYAVSELLPTEIKIAVIEQRGNRQAQLLNVFAGSAEVRTVQIRVINTNRTYDFLVIFSNDHLAPQNQCIQGQNWLGPVLVMKLARSGT